MKLEQFAMERMQSTYENLVEYNLSESGVRPLSTRELLGDAAAIDWPTPSPMGRLSFARQLPRCIRARPSTMSRSPTVAPRPTTSPRGVWSNPATTS
jgi:hypothetical protein